MRHLIAVLFIMIVFGLPWLYVNDPNDFRYVISIVVDTGTQLASVVISHNPKTITAIQAKYNSASGTFFPSQYTSKVRILLVPGHEPEYGGAEYDSPFGYLKERDLAAELADNIQGFLNQDPHYQVFTTRNAKAWNPVFTDYFNKEKDDIAAWRKIHVQEFLNLISLGKVQPTTPSVFHNRVKDEVAMRLYGIDKWANENDIDIIIHIHFNDYPGHGNVPGKYSGLAIYVPEEQYFNSSTTRAVADSIFKRLVKYNPTSDFRGESGGIIEDPDLIALGAYNSVDAASMLVEYSYIYEPQLVNTETRALFLKDLAYETYLGLQDLFDSRNITLKANQYDTLILPHSWKDQITDQGKATPDIFALQTALLVDGEYPPADMDKNDCRRTGRFGPCTKAALEAFQTKNGINSEKGTVGPKTLQLLNERFGAKMI